MSAALAIAAATLVSEDLALLGAVGLWTSGRIGFLAAFWGAFGGIAIGDLGLYGLGYLLGARLLNAPWLEGQRWRNLGGRLAVGKPAFVLLARLLPGSRLGGYTASGALRVAFLPFATAVCLGALAWVLFWFGLASPIGARLGTAATTAILAAALGIAYWIARGFYGHEWRLRLIGLQRLRWPEFWPAWLFYLPVAPYYAWLSLRFGDALLPTRSNPGIRHGGVINESKDAIFKLLPTHPAVLAWSLNEPGDRPTSVAFPVVAKPDAGQRGSGVRLIRSQVELDAYASNADFRFLVQEYCAYPKETGVFYARPPEELEGRLFSLTRKIFPEVRGDGKRTLAELILSDPRNRFMARVHFERHAARLSEIIPDGECIRLVESGNHCQGAVFLDGRHLAQEGLSREIDRITKAMPGFYVGRFDLRYDSEEALTQGRGFKIIEVNGATSEATHIYDPSLGIGEIYRTLFAQWRLVFEIGAQNRRRGSESATLAGLMSDLLAYRRSSRRHPMSS